MLAGRRAPVDMLAGRRALEKMLSVAQGMLQPVAGGWRLARCSLTAVAAHTCDLEASREQHLGWAGGKPGCAPVKANG